MAKRLTAYVPVETSDGPAEMPLTTYRNLSVQDQQPPIIVRKSEVPSRDLARLPPTRGSGGGGRKGG